MRKAQLTKQRLIVILKSVEAGPTVKSICREAGIATNLTRSQLLNTPQC